MTDMKHGPRVGRGRWRRVKALLQDLFGKKSPPSCWPTEELWNAAELAAYHGFRERDAAKYLGVPQRPRLSARERRWQRRDLARCPCGRAFKMVRHDCCPACGEFYIPF
jgi:hypothetical protein